MNDAEFNRLTNRGDSSRSLSSLERRNAEIVLSVYAAFAGRWVVEEQRMLYTADFVDHSTIHGRTFTDLAEFVETFRAAFPNGSVTVDRMLVDGDFVVAQVTGRLSSDHPLDAAMEIFRFKDGRIAEHWDVIRPNADFAGGVEPPRPNA
jgi:predicted SnoaL-like aldol condensation-catalyzing enzyme